MALLWFAYFLCLCSSQEVNAFYAINISIWYTWDIFETSPYEGIRYNTIWSSVYALLNSSPNELSALRDVTLNKNDVVYQSSEYFGMNVEVESDTDSVERYVRYSLSDDIMATLQSLPWNILRVNSTIENIISDGTKTRVWRIVVLIWIMCLVVSVTMYVLRKRRKRNRASIFDAHAYINGLSHEKPQNDFNPFRDGQYSGYYHQRGRKYEVRPFTLRFGPQSKDLGSSITAFTVTGRGSDEFGAYSMEGVYSRKTQRMTLIKSYITRSKKPISRKEIRLEYFQEKHKFIGTWLDELDEGVFALQYEGIGLVTRTAQSLTLSRQLLSPQSESVDESRKKNGRKYKSISNLEIIHEAECSE